MDADSKCLTPDRVTGHEWMEICGEEDEQCMGVFTDQEVERLLPSPNKHDDATHDMVPNDVRKEPKLQNYYDDIVHMIKKTKEKRKY